jgi:hypothetical protein
MSIFYELRKVKGLKKKPSTSELMDWIKLLTVGKITASFLEQEAKRGNLPYLGAVIKNEQDLNLINR